MANTPGLLGALREQTTKIEHLIDILSGPVKPFIPAIGRFLIVAVYFENAITITMEWNDQSVYLNEYRKLDPRMTLPFLVSNVMAMSICAMLIVAAKYSEAAVAGLVVVTVMQAFVYGLVFDLNYFLRNLLVMGSLCLALSNEWIKKSKAFAGLLSINNNVRRRYLHLASRVLLIGLFIGFISSGPWNTWRIAVAILGFIACIMVAVGFQSKFSAIMLVVILSVFNLVVNNFWTLHQRHPSRDFAKYDFFQTLSMVGGVLLLMSSGLEIDGTKDDDCKYDWGRRSRKVFAEGEV